MSHYATLLPVVLLDHEKSWVKGRTWNTVAAAGPSSGHMDLPVKVECLGQGSTHQPFFATAFVTAAQPHELETERRCCLT